MVDINKIKKALSASNFEGEMEYLGYLHKQTYSGEHIFQDLKGTLIIFNNKNESFISYMKCREEKLNDASFGIKRGGEMTLKVTQKNQYVTEDEDWAFSDGVSAGVKAMCEKFNINENDVYQKSSEVKE